MSTSSGQQPESRAARRATPSAPNRRSPNGTRNGTRNGSRNGARKGSRPTTRQRRSFGEWLRAPWKVWLKRLGITAAAAFTLALIGAVFAFLAVDIPDANALAEAQTTIVYYDDGKTELARIAELNRESIPLASVPKPVQQAVIAAEDRDFYSNSGVSPSGIGRSIWQALKGSDVQGGGSTITQQYVKNYFLTQDRTIDRKLREMIIAIKIDRDLSKDQILEGYLNTIYYGRGAYGIQAAAKAYFNKDASALNVSEGAVLASVMNAPSLFDPALGEKQKTNLANRWTYVMDGMVSMGALSAADRAAAKLPEIQAKAPSRALSGPTGYLAAAVRQELATKLKLSSEDIDRGGLRITTTINKKAQDAAVASVDKNFPKANATDVYAGLVAVRPGDGAVVAMYGGADYQKRQFSAATDAKIPAGSTFKPFALIAALQQGISTKSTIDGSSPLRDKALGIDRIENEGGRSYGTVDLRRATASSINTAFVRLNAKIGAQATRDAAVAAGIPDSTLGLGTEITNVLGNASPRVYDVANAYATIAAEGRRATPYLVKRVTSPAIDVDFTAQPNVVDAFGKDVAADVIDAMQAVTANGGTGARAQQIGRPSAGKTGTSEERKSVWFSGYTPQLATSVAMYKDVNGTPAPLTGIGGLDELSGNSFPLSIWIDFMKGALDGEQKVDFPKRAGIGDDKVRTVAPPAPATSAPAVTTDPTQAPPAPTVEPTVPAPTQTPTKTVGPTTQPTATKPGGKPTTPPGQSTATAPAPAP